MTDSKSFGPRGELVLRIIAQRQDTNRVGDIYAGWLLQQMDLAASETAFRVSQGRASTIAVESIQFISPLRVGAPVSIYSRLAETGRSSMKIAIEVWTQDEHVTEPRKVTEALFVYVAIDEKGRIRELPGS